MVARWEGEGSAVQLRKGATVTVYHDPLTRERPEGEAQLVRRIAGPAADPGREWWEVRFPGESDTVGRMIVTEAP